MRSDAAGHRGRHNETYMRAAAGTLLQVDLAMRCVKLCWMALLHRKLGRPSRISGSILAVRRQTAMLDTSAMAQQSRESTSLQPLDNLTPQIKVQVSKRLEPMVEERYSLRTASFGRMVYRIGKSLRLPAQQV